MDHSPMFITKNPTCESISVIQLWFENGHSRLPVQYNKALCPVKQLVYSG